MGACAKRDHRFHKNSVFIRPHVDIKTAFFKNLYSEGSLILRRSMQSVFEKKKFGDHFHRPVRVFSHKARSARSEVIDRATLTRPCGAREDSEWSYDQRKNTDSFQV